MSSLNHGTASEVSGRGVSAGGLALQMGLSDLSSARIAQGHILFCSRRNCLCWCRSANKDGILGGYLTVLPFPNKKIMFRSIASEHVGPFMDS